MGSTKPLSVVRVRHAPRISLMNLANSDKSACSFDGDEISLGKSAKGKCVSTDAVGIHIGEGWSVQVDRRNQLNYNWKNGLSPLAGQDLLSSAFDTRCDERRSSEQTECKGTSGSFNGEELMLKMTTDDFVGESLRRDIEDGRTATGAATTCDLPVRSDDPLFGESRQYENGFTMDSSRVCCQGYSVERRENGGTSLLLSSSLFKRKGPSYKRWGKDRWMNGNIGHTDVNQEKGARLEETLRELASECTRTNNGPERKRGKRLEDGSVWFGGMRKVLPASRRYEAKVLIDEWTVDIIGRELNNNEYGMGASSVGSLLLDESSKLVTSLRSAQIIGNVNMFVTSADNLESIQRRIRYLIDSMPRITPDEENESTYRVTLVVPNRAVGRIMGRGGEYIKALGKVAAVNIHVSQPMIFQDMLNGNVITERLVIATAGDKSGLRMAIKSLLRTLNDHTNTGRQNTVRQWAVFDDDDDNWRGRGVNKSPTTFERAPAASFESARSNMMYEEMSTNEEQQQMIPNITRSAASFHDQPDVDEQPPDASAVLATHPKIRPPTFDEDRSDLEDSSSPPPSPSMFPIHEAIYGPGTAHVRPTTSHDDDGGGLRTPPDPQKMKEICRTPQLIYEVSPLPSPTQFCDEVNDSRLTPADAEVVDISFFRLDKTHPPLDEKSKEEAGPLRQWRIVHE